MQKPGLPKGTRDFTPAMVQKRKYILQTIEKVFVKYGFMPIETPSMENLSTLEGKYGEEGDKLLFRIINSGDTLSEVKNHQNELKEQKDLNKLITEKGLRYDLTVPFARYVVMNRNEITFPFKRYQMQPVWRADRPQKGRYREFWQCDADVVGSNSLLHEVDLMMIYLEVFGLLGLEVQVKYNNRKILDGFSQVLGIPDKLTEMTIALDKQDKIGTDAVLKELLVLGADPEQLKLMVGCLDDPTNKLPAFLGSNEIGNIGMQELQTISAYLNAYENGTHQKSGNKIVHDIALARGLSYYTGSIFEVVASVGTLKSSIGGGGRYDNLTGVFGLPGVSGVGISFGLDRIYDVLEELQLFPSNLHTSTTKVLVCALDEKVQPYALGILAALRNEGIASEIYPECKKIGKQLDYANALKIPFALIIGENEMNNKTVMCKDLMEGKQEEMNLTDIVNKLN